LPAAILCLTSVFLFVFFSVGDAAPADQGAAPAADAAKTADAPAAAAASGDDAAAGEAAAKAE